MKTPEIFPWSEHFLTGLDIVDEQHSHLVQLLNQLAGSLVFGTDAPEVRQALGALTAYASYHFRTEEELWIRELGDGPLATAHRKIHGAFKAELAAFMTRDVSEVKTLVQEILFFLTRWLADHILQSDRHMAAIIRGLKSGLSPEAARDQASREAHQSTAVLREAIVTLYAQFSRNALDMLREIESRNRANQALLDAKTQLRTIVDSTQDLVWAVEASDFSLSMYNQAFADFMSRSYGVSLLIGMSPQETFQDERLTHLWEGFYQSALSGGAFSTEYRTFNGARHLHLNLTLLRRDGEPFGVAVFAKDITERKAAEDSIRQLAFYDPLTKLPNRRLLEDRLHQAIASTERGGGISAALVGDLDNFKRLNDARGHNAGDSVLVEVARRLGSVVRGNDTIARVGSDEFVIILNSLAQTGEAATRGCQAICQRILEAICQPYGEGDRAYQTTMSLGACFFEKGTPSPAELLQNADTAMHAAKDAGRNQLCFFDPAMKASLESRVSLETAMRAGFPSEFTLHFQPQVDLGGRPFGAEALIRWKHPQRGMVPPGEFVPLAEETGFILDLGNWVLTSACHLLKKLETRTRTRPLSLAVNVSARQFQQPDFVETVLAALDASGADPHLLKLELTESMLVFDVEDVIAKMSTLKALGVNFALDDFGTGFSSLSALKRLPLDQVKIDQSFVRDILTNPNDAAIARTVIALGRSLGLTVIAEGVETAEQRDFLAIHGCTQFQGYLYSRPLPLTAFEAYLG
nr:EAL domain-containing protein [uncultured Holophaga sp.]